MRMLYAVFFLSGLAALMFEALWFRQAGLAFGNSVWASTLVLSSFMAGLALGNAGAARWGGRTARPVRAYAALELTIGVVGWALVWGLPEMGSLLAPLFGPLLDRPGILNALRLGIAFALLLVPATAMGATLPVMVRALFARDPHFGRVLGRLYGLNTLGAVVGVLLGELLLYDHLGLLGTAAVATLVNVVAAGSALVVTRGWGELAPGPGPSGAAAEVAAAAAAAGEGEAAPPSARPPSGVVRFLAAASVAGGAMMALEVVWFRFLGQYVNATGLAFSVMLSVVLAGIALGGLAAGQLLKRDPEAHRFAPLLAVAAGLATLWSYVVFTAFPGDSGRLYVLDAASMLKLALALMFPTSLASGALFVMLGPRVHREWSDETRSSGWLTLSNTTGAMLGSIAGGALLLPVLGVEVSIFVVGLGYGVVALLSLPAGEELSRRGRQAVAAAGGVWLLSLLLFPFGLMDNFFFPSTVRFYTENDGSAVVAWREGRTETASYLRSDFLGEPFAYRLVTNGFSMSATHFVGRRYMKQYVLWPALFHEEPRSALLVSYGVGSTAKALTDTASLERIDVVDISRDILELNEVVFPDPAEHPLRDPRVHVHVEDGRFFLQTTDRRYDIFTGEPPPPKHAGITSLYSKEYFELVHDRLADGGIATYWLPIDQMQWGEGLAILRAWCDVFDECSLWQGFDGNWMMVGARGEIAPTTEAAMRRIWDDPRLRPELDAIYFESPELFLAGFLADADQLAAMLEGVAPLTDNWPGRLTRGAMAPETDDAVKFARPGSTRPRFLESAWIREHVPAETVSRTAALIPLTPIVHLEWDDAGREKHHGTIATLHRIFTESDLRVLPLRVLQADPDRQRIAARVTPTNAVVPALQYLGAARSLAERRWAEADQRFAACQATTPGQDVFFAYRIFALCMDERPDDARALANRAFTSAGADWIGPEFWPWLNETFALDPKIEPPPR